MYKTKNMLNLAAMKEKERLQEELNKHAPLLQPLREREDGLQVPPGYFDNLEAGVFRQLDAIGARRKPLAPMARPGLWNRLQALFQPRTALAFAGVLALMLAAWWYFGPQQSGGTQTALSDISAEDAEAYLFDNALELEPEQIALALPADDLPLITIQAPENAASGDPATPVKELQLSPDDLNELLDDMSDDELKELL